jgi:hypothetical protein
MADDIEQFARSIHDIALRGVAEEKVRAVLNQARIARVMEQAGSVRMNGIGQKIAGIDPRTFFRWEQEFPGCWRNKEFVREYLRDNPNARAPGYKPTRK